MVATGQSSTLGCLHGEYMALLPLTKADRLALARLVVQEEGEDATYQAALAIASALLRHFVVVNDSRAERVVPPLWGSVAGLAAAYAHWPPADNRPRAQRIQRLGWTQFAEPIRVAVHGLVTGAAQLTAYPAEHWGIPGDPLLQDGPAMGMQIVPSAAANTLLSTPKSRAHSEVIVTQSASGRKGLSRWAALAMGTGIGALVVSLWPRR